MDRVKKSDYDSLPTGEKVSKFTLTNKFQVEVEVIDYGATVIALKTPDRNGCFADVIVGYDNMNDLYSNAPYFGSTVGRVANRIANGRFTLDGREYTLDVNCGVHHLHGGLKGFSKRIWASEYKEDSQSASVSFSLTSPDGEDGYPGTLDVTVTYSLNDNNELKILYRGLVREKATIVNLTNHAYFNLAGQVSQDVLDHILEIKAESYLPSDDTCCPSGEIRPVSEDGVFDFRKPKTIGRDIGKTPNHGYDNTFCLENGLAECSVRVCDPSSGRVLEVFTNQPGVQLYTFNISNPMTGKGKIEYNRHSAFCLETQNYPNAINQANFPSCVLRPGEEYHHETIYRFSVDD